MINKKLDNIRIEKNIAIAMTQEVGVKVSKIMKSNFNYKNNIDEAARNNSTIEELKKIEIKKAFKLEKER